MTLHGAARTAHERRVLIDAARARLTDRDPQAVPETVALLNAADRLGRREDWTRATPWDMTGVGI